MLWRLSDPHHVDFGQYLTFEELVDSLNATENSNVVEHWIQKHETTWQNQKAWRKPSTKMQWRTSMTKDDIIITQAEASLLTQMFGEKMIPSTQVFQFQKCPIQIPADLQEVVEYIYFGALCSYPFHRHRRREEIITSSSPVTIDPPRLYHLYDINHRVSSSSQSVAEFEQAYFYRSDLNTFANRYHLPPTKVEIVGPNHPDDGGYLGEASLDTQYASAMAPLGNLWVFSNGIFDLSWWVETILNQTTQTAPRVHSISWGSPEDDFDEKLLRRWNFEFLKLALLGHSVIVASGDHGADNSGWFHCRKFRVQFPASSPYVTAVGGTALLDYDNHKNETAWEYSGGGFSRYFDRPPYQKKAVSEYLNAAKNKLPPSQYYNLRGRAVPDVSAVSTQYQVLMQGFWANVSGTSAAAPLWAGMMANSRTRGFLNPWLYSLPSIGRDIMTGYNVGGRACAKGFPATVGYDAVTGLGVPNQTLLILWEANHRRFHGSTKVRVD